MISMFKKEFKTSESSREYARAWYKKNADKIRAKARKYYLKNKPPGNGKSKSPFKNRSENGHHNSIGYKYYQYRFDARKRGLEFNICPEVFESLWQRPCHYCGDAIKTIGLDRVDNNIGYIESNVVPCCFFCNAVKCRMTKDEFIARCVKVAARHGGY